MGRGKKRGGRGRKEGEKRGREKGEMTHSCIPSEVCPNVVPAVHVENLMSCIND